MKTRCAMERDLGYDVSTDADVSLLLQFSPLAMYTCNADGYITAFNSAAAKLWGVEPRLGKDRWCGSWKIYYPDGLPMALEDCPMAISLRREKSFESAEILIERPDHSFRNVLIYPRLIFNQDNQLTGAYNTIVDITNQKDGDQKHALLSAIVESSDDAIISKTLEGIIVSWNKGAEKIFGYTEKEMLGKHIYKLIPVHSQHEEEIIISNIKAGKRIDHFQTLRLTKSGKEVPVSITVSPIKDIHGNIIGASKIGRDITDQLLREEQIRLIAKRLEILNSLGKRIAGNLNVNEILQEVTDASTLITGAAFGAFFYNKTDSHGESFLLYALSGAPREAFDKFGMPRNTEVFHATFSGLGIVRVDDITKDPRYGKNVPHKGMPAGHLPVVSYLAVPVISANGTVIGGLFFGHPQPGIFTKDHEELVDGIASQAAVVLDKAKLFEEVKELNEKKDEFIAMASHELKTPLTTVKGYLQILLQMETPSLSRQFIEKSLKQVNRLDSLATDLFEISKIEAGKLQLSLEPFNLRTLIEEMMETFAHIYPDNQIKLIAASTIYPVIADQQRIEQVLINLLTNAVKYAPEIKDIEIKLEQTTAEIIVAVTDHGIGLTQQQQEKVFTRFYRAQDNSNISGLGLGLHISKEIIERHRGRINVISELGKGSTFTFAIPATPQH